MLDNLGEQPLFGNFFRGGQAFFPWRQVGVSLTNFFTGPSVLLEKGDDMTGGLNSSVKLPAFLSLIGEKFVQAFQPRGAGKFDGG